MSLKNLLHQKLVEKGYLSYGEVCQICAEEGYKGETATRRLREMKDIQKEEKKSKRGTYYISGYRYNPDTLSSIWPARYSDPCDCKDCMPPKETSLFPSYHFKKKSDIIQDQDWRQ